MEKQNNIPKLRFPDFSDAWEMKKLKDKISYIKGFAFQSVFYTSSGIRIVRVSDLGADNIKHDNQKIYIDQVQAIGLDKYLINKNDIIITTVGSKPELLESAVGRGIFVNEENEGFLNQNLLKINAQSTYENGFLFGYINSKKYISHIKEIQRGNANQSNITVVDLFDYEVFFPTLPEQQKIATFLSTVDEKNNALKKKKSLLEAYKKGVMQKLFSQQIRFKDDAGNDFGDWEVKTLGEIAKINPKAEKLPNSFIYIDLESVDKGRLNIKERIFLSDAPSRAQRLVKKDDILFQMVRPYQKNNFYFNIDETDYVASTGYAQIRTDEDSNFIYQFLHTDEFVNNVLERCTGTGYPAINSTDLSNIEIPCKKEQTKIANFLTVIDEKINKVDAQIKQTELWKKGLLQQMFV